MDTNSPLFLLSGFLLGTGLGLATGALCGLKSLARAKTSYARELLSIARRYAPLVDTAPPRIRITEERDVIDFAAIVRQMRSLKQVNSAVAYQPTDAMSCSIAPAVPPPALSGPASLSI